MYVKYFDLIWEVDKFCCFISFRKHCAPPLTIFLYLFCWNELFSVFFFITNITDSKCGIVCKRKIFRVNKKWKKNTKNGKRVKYFDATVFYFVFHNFFFKFGFGANMILPHKVIQSNFYPICDFLCMSHYSCMYIYKVCLLSLLVSDKNDDYQKRCHIHMCVTVVKLEDFWSYEMHSSLQICYR